MQATTTTATLPANGRIMGCSLGGFYGNFRMVRLVSRTNGPDRVRCRRPACRLARRVYAAQSSGLDLVGMLNAYEQGRYDEAVAKRPPCQTSAPFRLRFVQDSPVWVNADPARSDRRSGVAAAFLLEVAAARLESDWGRFSDLIEWTCVQLRATAHADGVRARVACRVARAGRACARARLAARPLSAPAASEAGRRTSDEGERAAAGDALDARARAFPDDPQFQLSRVVAWTWGRDGEPIRNVRA